MSCILTSSSGLVFVAPATSDTVGSAGPACDSSDARCTRPSSTANNESRNAFVILEVNSGATVFRLTKRDEEVAAEDDRSTPPAILNAHVDSSFWNARNLER